MTSHPNRTKRPDAAGRNPEPAEIQEARLAFGYTQTEAGALVYCTLRAWQDWESGERRMHPATWDLFRMRAGAPDETGMAMANANRTLANKVRALARRDEAGAP